MAISQVTVIGRPQPRTWKQYREGALMNFAGGHHSDGHLDAFQHGMETVFNLLEAEFLPAEECKRRPPNPHGWIVVCLGCGCAPGPDGKKCKFNCACHDHEAAERCRADARATPIEQIIRALAERGWLNLKDDQDYGDIETVIGNVLVNGFHGGTGAIGAIQNFKRTRGKHDGPHDSLGGTNCSRCETAYVEAEEKLDSITHDEDCPCYGDRVEHSEDCANCTCND